VTAQGSARTRFNRAVERRSVALAEDAAREMGRVSVREALALVVLYASVDDAKFERAAVRWLARLATERSDVTVQQLALAATAFLELRGRRREEATLLLTALS
jgi:hypothetical protein